jgi:hypothetical protein
VGILLGTAWLAVDAAGQAPSLPAGARLRLLVDREASSAQPEPFSGTTVYVSTSGADTKSGTQSNPVRTIQRGVVLANQILASNTNARVLIAAGTSGAGGPWRATAYERRARSGGCGREHDSERRR